MRRTSSEAGPVAAQVGPRGSGATAPHLCTCLHRCRAWHAGLSILHAYATRRSLEAQPGSSCCTCPHPAPPALSLDLLLHSAYQGARQSPRTHTARPSPGSAQTEMGLEFCPRVSGSPAHAGTGVQVSQNCPRPARPPQPWQQRAVHVHHAWRLRPPPSRAACSPDPFPFSQSQKHHLLQDLY